MGQLPAKLSAESAHTFWPLCAQDIQKTPYEMQRKHEQNIYKLSV